MDREEEWKIGVHKDGFGEGTKQIVQWEVEVVEHREWRKGGDRVGDRAVGNDKVLECLKQCKRGGEGAPAEKQRDKIDRNDTALCVHTTLEYKQ